MLHKICFALLLSTPLLADVVTLPAAKDATIFDDGVGNTASGQDKGLYSGRAGSFTTTPVRRVVLAFDVAAALPTGATIQSVQLELYMSQTTSTARPFDLYKLTQAWNEGPTIGFSGSGGAAVPGDVTWVHTNWNTQSWSTPGGSFVPTISASTSVGAAGPYTWGSTAQLVADVQGWLDAPASSAGWILRGPEQSGQVSAKKFEARNSDTLAWRPALVITYAPPAPTVYCTSKTNSLGCVPGIGFSGAPSASAGSGFMITLANAISQQNGLLFYGVNGPNTAPFSGGTLCVRAPLVRLPVLAAGGNPPPSDCSGAYTFDFNAHIAAGVDATLVSGALVHAQWWTRDPPDPFTTNVSDALRFTILL